jgi:hypothetical protein
MWTHVLPIQHPIEGGHFVTTLDGIEDSISTYLHYFKDFGG